MTSAERTTESMERQVAQILGEPVVGVAAANRYGTLGAIVSGTLTRIATSAGDTPLGGAYVPKDDIRRAGEPIAALPHAFLLAVTETLLHVFKMRGVLGRVKVKEEIGAFDRDGLEIATHEEALVRRFAIRSPGQDQEMAFEITRSDYATEFASLLQHGSLNRARALADGGRDFWWVLKILLIVMIVSTTLLAVVTMIFLWS